MDGVFCSQQKNSLREDAATKSETKSDFKKIKKKKKLNQSSI